MDTGKLKIFSFVAFHFYFDGNNLKDAPQVKRSAFE